MGTSASSSSTVPATPSLLNPASLGVTGLATGSGVRAGEEKNDEKKPVRAGAAGELVGALGGGGSGVFTAAAGEGGGGFADAEGFGGTELLGVARGV